MTVSSRDRIRIPIRLLGLGMLAKSGLFDAEASAPWTLPKAGAAVADRIVKSGDPKSTYMYDLALEGMLALDAAFPEAGWKAFVLKVAADRRLTSRSPVPWRKQPFGCFTFALHQATGDDAWLEVFLDESRKERDEVERATDGAILHPRGASRGGGFAILIDAMQEYACRMARAGAKLGDPSYFEECGRQFRLYQAVLRDPATGLWSQGKGWIKDRPEALSPGAWSRGHGWLIRGLEESLWWLPRGSAPFVEVRKILRETADAVLARQTDDGLWPCLLHRPPADSPRETSGSAMIAAHLARGVRNGVLEAEPYGRAAERAFAALPGYVRPDGVVRSASPGPGPLESEEPWLRPAYPDDDPHGTFAILLAAVEAARSGG